MSEDRHRLCSVEARERAERITEQALAATGEHHHRRAQELRARERSAEAGAEYTLAVRAYRMYLARFASSPRAYDIGWNLAEALYWSGEHDEAARAYEAVRDSRIDDRLMAAAARRVVESRTRALEREVRAGAIALREDPPRDPSGAVRPEAVPPALREVARAREIYVRWIEHDSEHVRDAYAFNNAAMLYRYGFWDAARARFRALYEARCGGPAASRVGFDALLALRDMARENLTELERLAADARQRNCTFHPEGSRELAAMESDVAFARLDRDARQLSGDDRERRARAETIARGLIEAVDRAPDHEDAPAALHRAAHLLLDQAGRPAAAEQLFQRIVDEVTPLATGERRALLDPIVADAHLQLARIAHRTFDVDRALSAYATLASAERFAASRDPDVARMRRDALVNAALLASSAGYHRRAAGAWQEAADVLDGAEAREALLRAGEERLEAGDARAAARELDAWMRAHGSSADVYSVRGAWARAEAARLVRDGAARDRALAIAVDRHRASGAASDTRSAELAARAALALADARAAASSPGQIRVRAARDVPAMIAALSSAITAESQRALASVEAYDSVVAIGRAPESAAALTRQGALYEALVRSVLEAEVELPRAVQRSVGNTPPAAQAHSRAMFQDTIRSTLDQQMRPVECRAIERYVLATRLARRAGLSGPDIERAHERLAAYGEERVRDCIREAAERDETLAPLADRELDRAHPGRHLAPAASIAPPPLER